MVGTQTVAPSFLVSAASPRQFPSDGSPTRMQEIAFLGRSNVGKSSLLNTLLKQPGLAFTSSRPGCTQLINFFQVQPHLRFVDLPGYGYARVSLEEKESWKVLIDSYLENRQQLALSFLLIDARRGWMDMDLELQSWLTYEQRRYQVIVTKADKLKSNNQLKAGLNTIRKQTTAGEEPVAFSALDGRGVREIWQIISKIQKQ